MGSTTVKEMSGVNIIGHGPEWDSIKEQQGWEDFLAWCRDQENPAHE
jgi:hypothetical protein